MCVCTYTYVYSNKFEEKKSRFLENKINILVKILNYSQDEK